MKDYLQKLNAAQKEAVTAASKHILVLAGAGSGKTRVLTSRILWLLEEKDIPARAILALTFTNKAAEEMRQRVQNASLRAHDVMLTTFHSYGAWFLREYSGYCGFSRYFSIYDDEEAVTLLKRLYPREPLSQLKFYYHQIQRCKDGSLKMQEEQDLQMVYAAYNAALRENRAVDFGDLIYLPQIFLSENPLLRRAVHQRWGAILVDEYQDTNARQAKMLMQMISENAYVMAVGDDDQSIYGFRGAEPTNMIDFTKNLPDCHVVKLEENYRSTPAILACANQVIAHNSGRLGKQLFSRKETGAKPQVMILENQDDEANYLCRLLQDGRLAQTAVLYRVNAQSRSIESALTKAKIPYIILGSIRFYQREEIKTVLAWLTFLLNPFDEAAFSRLIARPASGIGKKNLALILSHRGEEGNLLRALQSSLTKMKGRAVGSCARLAGLFEKWNEDLEKESLSDFFQTFIHESGLFEFYSAQDAAEYTQRLNNIRELSTVLQTYGRGREALSEFLETVMLDQSAEELSGNRRDERVTLMTVHNAKGLEFERIILLGMEEELFPWENAQGQDIEEERRLCYVAVTRAKEQLYITATRQRSLYGKTAFRHPSRFLSEMGEENLDMMMGAYGQEHRACQAGGESAGPAAYRKGDWVRHEDYGVGRIICSQVISGRQVIDVHFEGGRRAKFLPEFTPLEKLPAPDFE